MTTFKISIDNTIYLSFKKSILDTTYTSLLNLTQPLITYNEILNELNIDLKYDSITTIKVNKQLYDSFKIDNIKSKFNLQDLVSRSMYLYMNDKEFRDKLYNFILPLLSEASQQTVLNISGSKKV